MSDTTPRPDETPSGSTVPPPPPPTEPLAETPQVSEPAAGMPPAGSEPATPPAPSEPVAAVPSTGEQATEYGQQVQAPEYAQQAPPPPPPPYSPPAPGQALTGPAPMEPSQERTAGLAAHGVTLAATVFSSGFLGFVCALIMYLVFRDRGPFVRSHAANALNIQIIAGIVMLVSLPLMLLIVGFFTFGAALVWAIVMHIIGMVKANNGEWWNPPLTPQFVK